MTKRETEDRPDAGARTDQVLQSFLLSMPGHVNEGVPDISSHDGAPYAELVKAFFANLHAVMSSATLPFTLVATAVRERRLQIRAAAEQIRACVHLMDEGEERDRIEIEVLNRVVKEFDEESEKQEGQWKSMMQEIVDDLFMLLNDNRTISTPQEILRQSLVGTWGCFEVFVSDYCCAILNNNPSIAVSLMESSVSKKHFESLGPKGYISLDYLQACNFDLKTKMGDLILSGRRFDNIAIMGDVLKVLFPRRATLHQVISSPTLWMLNQRRHLIVHRRGIVDDAYLRRTQDTLPLGSRIELTSANIRDYFQAVERSASELISAAASLE